MTAAEKTNKIILSGVMMAIVTVSTMLLAIPVPFTNGYIHLGDSMVFLSVLILGWKYGAVVAGGGSALADIFLSYVHWAPWTFIIKALMALVMGLAIEKTRHNKKNLGIVLVVTIIIWGIFNLAVGHIISYEALHRPANLVGAGVEDLSSLGSVITSMQMKLMVIAVAIPLMLLVVSFIIKKKEHFTVPLTEILAMTLSGLFMVFGYYVAGGLIYGNFAVAAFSIPMNIIQFVMGFLLATLLRVALSKTPVKKFFTY